jgi:hypothetical protein
MVGGLRVNVSRCARRAESFDRVLGGASSDSVVRRGDKAVIWRRELVAWKLFRELAMRRGRASTFDMARALANQSEVAPREWQACLPSACYHPTNTTI